MKTIFTLLIMSLCFSANLFAQKALPKDADAEQTKIWLKKNLVKKVRIISEVNIDGCQMSVKEFSSDLLGGRRSGGFVGGGFPNDDSSNYLSAGPDSNINSRIKKRIITFALSDFDIEKITIRKSFLKNKSVIVLQTADMKNSVELTENKNTLKRPSFEFTVKTNSAENFVDAFRQAIKQCKE